MSITDRIDNTRDAFLNQADRLLDYMAERLRTLWDLQFDSEGAVAAAFGDYGAKWPGLSPATVWLKLLISPGGGVDRPGIDTGRLKNSLVITKVGKAAYKISIDDPMVFMMEFGWSVDVSPGSKKGDRVRAFFAAHQWPLSPKTRKLIIPARPILGPILRMLEHEASREASRIFKQPVFITFDIRWKTK